MSAPAKHCMIVDDNEIVRMIARHALARIGLRVSEAENGQEALEKCRAEMPDGVVIDLDMPNLDGLEVARALRRLPEGARPRIVLCTSDPTEGRLHAARWAGVDDVLEKPFTSRTLEAKAAHIGLVADGESR